MNIDKFYEKVFRESRNVVKYNSFIAAFLGRFFDFSKNNRIEVTKEILQMNSNGIKDRIIDIGCWGGQGLKAINAFSLYKEVYGIDVFDVSVQQAKLLGINAFKIDLNNGKLPFQEEYFDTVTCLAVIEHVFDPFSVISDISRVLRTGGNLIISFPNVAILTNRLRLFFGYLPVTSKGDGWDGGHLHYFTINRFIGLLRRYKLEVVEKKATSGFTSIRNLWLALLGGEIIIVAKKVPASAG